MAPNTWQRWLEQLANSPRKNKQSRRTTRPRFRPELIPLEARLAPASYTFSNPALITINDFAPASPYPSNISVSGVTGTVGDVNITLNGLTHTYPSDLGILLVGPTGANIYIMDYAGGGADVTGVVLTFDDQAASPIPYGSQITSGSWQCADYIGDLFDPPAPTPSGSVRLSDFNNLNPNGTWSLYVEDFAGADVGTIDTGWSITITTVDFPPTISDIPDQTINEDSDTGALPFTVDDLETPPANLTVSGSSSNPGLVPNGNIVFGGSGTNRTVTVTPLANQFGTATITVTVNDGTNNTSDTFLLTVNPVNDPPTISNITDRTIAENTSTGPIAFTIGDVDNPVGSLTLSGSSSNTTLVPNANIVFGGAGANRTVTVTPVVGQYGVTTITVTVSDGTDTTSDTFVLTVNALPTISNISDTTINEDNSTGAIPFTVNDNETPAGSLNVAAVSSNLALVPNANVFLGGAGTSRTVNVVPVANGFGTTTITVTVTDGNGGTAQDTFVVTVNPINDAPVALINGVPALPSEGATIFLSGTQTDVDSSAWTYQWSVIASNGQVIAPASTQNFNFTPNNNGTYTVTLVVTDNGSGPSAPLTGNLTIGITVNNANPTPIPGGPYNVFGGSSVQLFGNSSDPGALDTVTLVWDLDGDGIFGETGANASRGNENVANPIYLAAPTTTFSIKTISLRATDNDGGTSTRTTTVNVFPTVARFDFNAASQLTEPGFVGVRGADLFDATRGHGWASIAGEVDNANSTALYRDGHTGADNTFSVRVVPGATYQVTLWSRDIVDRNSIKVYAENNLRATYKLYSSKRKSDRVPNGFNATVAVKFDVVSTDGVLDLRFLAAGTNPLFIVNGLQITKK
jgi:subtilisin-like proprotein convertase family protein